MKAVMYGAGNIGRGFIGQLFYQSGYETVFIDVNLEVVESLINDRKYTIKIVDNKGCDEVTVENVSAINGMDIDKVADEIASCDIMCTAVGVNILPRIVSNLVQGLKRRFENGGKELNIIICENLIGADKYLKELIMSEISSEYHNYIENSVGFVEASVGRMVPVMTTEMKAGNPLMVWVEPFCSLPVDKGAFKGVIPNIKGMEPSAPFEYHIQSKLFLHNMGHALTAYMGNLQGHEYIWQAIEDPEIKSVCQKAMELSALALSLEHNKPYEEVRTYANNLIKRFENRYLCDTVARVGRDTKRKLSANDRLVGAAKLCKKHDVDNTYILTGIAAALLFESDDPGTKEVANILALRGAGAVLQELCKFEKSSYEYEKTLHIYESLKNSNL